jgi:Chaperone of endosialidase
MTKSQLRKSVNRSLWRRGFLLLSLVFGCFALSPIVQAVTPAPDGGYFGNNTAEGTQALQSLVSGALDNTATGFQALFRATDSLQNTATGFRALFNNTGDFNVAMGFQAALGNTVGDHNTAVGFNALMRNTAGDNNTALGFNAGANLTIGDDNIDIGNAGVTGETETIRIGTAGFQRRAFFVGIHGVPLVGSTVVVNTAGQLGVVPSSERFKEQIKPMDKASEAILSLKPVTFYYKKGIDSNRTAQFGLVAEDVAKVNADLVTCDSDGKVYTVRYEAVNAMLLNEFLKEHKIVQEQGAIIARQQKQIEALAAGLQKVSAQIELSKPAPQTVLNNH